MKRPRLKGIVLVTLMGLFGSISLALDRYAAIAAPVQAPRFEVDPFWPKPLPNHWVLGAAVGVWADAQDHIWMVHRGAQHPVIRQRLGPERIDFERRRLRGARLRGDVLTEADADDGAQHDDPGAHRDEALPR